MLQTKNLPLALFSIFCIKVLVTSTTYESVFTLAVLGVVAFLYEAFIQNSSIKNFQNKLDQIKKDDEAMKKELDQIKAYVSSMKLNNIRGPSGLNRTAQ